MLLRRLQFLILALSSMERIILSLQSPIGGPRRTTAFGSRNRRNASNLSPLSLSSTTTTIANEPELWPVPENEEHNEHFGDGEEDEDGELSMILDSIIKIHATHSEVSSHCRSTYAPVFSLIGLLT